MVFNLEYRNLKTHFLRDRTKILVLPLERMDSIFLECIEYTLAHCRLNSLSYPILQPNLAASMSSVRCEFSLLIRPMKPGGLNLHTSLITWTQHPTNAIPFVAQHSWWLGSGLLFTL